MNEINEASIENVTKRLKWLFKSTGLTQKAFAASVGIGNTQMNNWMTQRGRIPLEGALKINKVYGVSLDFLYLGRADTLPAHLAKSWAEKSLESASRASKD